MASALVEEFLAHQQSYNGVSERRCRMVRRFAESVEVMTGRPLEELTPVELEAWLSSLMAKGLHPNTVLYQLKGVRSFLLWAWRRHAVEAERWLRLRDVKPPRGAVPSMPRPLSRKEIEALWTELDKRFPKITPLSITRLRNGTSSPLASRARYLKGLQFEAIFTLALQGGLRRAEIHGLSIEAMHPDNAYIQLTNAARKGSPRERYREIPMTRDMRRAIAGWLEARAWLKPTHDFPWLTILPTDPTAPLTLRMLERRTARYGWELHRMRHTAGTEWLRAGMPLEQVRVLMGHASLQQTLAYAEIVGADVQRTALRLEDQLSAATMRVVVAA